MIGEISVTVLQLTTDPVANYFYTMGLAYGCVLFPFFAACLLLARS